MTRGHRTEDGAEDGVATTLGVLLCGVLLLCGVIAAGAVALVVDHRRAQAGADLAALAGATALQDGGDPCGVASRTARRNGAELETCRPRDLEVVVRVGVEGPALPGLSPVVLTATARAGPAASLGSGAR